MNNGLSTPQRNGLSMPVQPAAPAIAYVAGALQPLLVNTQQIAAATERFARIEGASFKDNLKFTYTEED
jgi:hypothetical protein